MTTATMSIAMTSIMAAVTWTMVCNAPQERYGVVKKPSGGHVLGGYPGVLSHCFNGTDPVRPLPLQSHYQFQKRGF